MIVFRSWIVITALLVCFLFAHSKAFAFDAVSITWSGTVSGASSPTDWCTPNAVSHLSLGFPTTWKCIDNSGVLSDGLNSSPSCPGGRQVDFARMACVPIENPGLDVLTQLFIGFSLLLAGVGGFQHGRRA